jgi:hypothetical protein
MYNLLFTAFTVSYIGGVDVDISYLKVLPNPNPGWFTKLKNKLINRKRRGASSKKTMDVVD